MKKKYLSILAAGTAALMLLSGCKDKHTHVTADIWEADLNNHWKACTECDGKTDENKHTFDDFYTCTVCGAQIVEWDDSTSLDIFNESGDPLKSAEYDANGNLVTETLYSYDYDGDGNLTHDVTTVDGVITDERYYTVVGGESITSQYIYYMDDGSKSVSDYDENENNVHSVYYNADGSEEWHDDSEFALSADGEWYQRKYTITYASGAKSVSEYNEKGDPISSVDYDVNGNVIFAYSWEYTYDENGNMETVKEYCDGMLTSDKIYKTLVTEEYTVTYPETVTEYGEDGGKTVTVYDENDNVISQESYDSNGSLIS